MLFASQLSSQVAAPTPLAMLTKDGRRALAVTLVNDQEFVALDDLSAAFQLTVRDDALGAVTVFYKGKTIVLTPEQTLASVAGRLVSLPSAPTRAARRILVPVEFISRALALIYDIRLDLRKPSHLLIVGDVRVPRVTVRYDVVGQGGRVTIDATPRADSTLTQDGSRLTIKFDADALDTANPLLTAQGPQSLIQDVRVVEPATLVVTLGPRFAGFRSTTQPVDTTTRLTLDVVAAQTDAVAAAPGAPPAPPPPDLPPAFGQPASIRTIAIDAGHGGADEGVKGPAGTKEKDIALAVARRLKAAIEGRLGIRVLLTRDDDRDMPIDDRTAVANNNKSDLLISLHANGSVRSAATGASIYYAAFEKDATAAGTAPRAERVPTFGGGTRDIEIVTWNLAQMRYLDASMTFAGILQEQFHDRVPLATHAVDRASLRVLESANMPAVLIEMGFLSNADQEKQLAGAEFQAAFVQAVTDAVVTLRDALASQGAK